MRFSFRSLFWPLAGATVVHALIGWPLLEHWRVSGPGLHTVLAISLVPAAGLARHSTVVPSVDAIPHPTPPVVVTRSPPNALTQRPASPADIAPAPAIEVAAPTVGTAVLIADSNASADAAAQAEHFFLASELTRLPALPGEPLIDLGEDAAVLEGSVALQLFIDETGRVVDSQVEGSHGLPAVVSDKLTRAFAGYSYLPGQRDGRPVKSQVTLIIGIRDGQAATNAPQ